jgi:transcriptional regulator with XRE-family HTH domain
MDYANNKDVEINAIDSYVGVKLRVRRTLLGMSQMDLAKKLGIVFQQLQKYEQGFNRIGASRLFEISQILGVEVSYFFEGLAAHSEQTLHEFRTQNDPTMTRETLELVRAFGKIYEPDVRSALLLLLNDLTNKKSLP